MQFPLASLAVLGMCITTQSGALIAQTLLWTPLTEGLVDPMYTFGWLAAFQSCALLALVIFRGLLVFTTMRNTLGHLLRPLHIFDSPNPAELWAIGIIGLLALVARTVSELGLMGKVLDGLRFLAWAPFLIPVLHVMRPGYSADMRRQWHALALFLLLAVLIALIANARNLMFLGVVTAGLLLLLLTLRDQRAAGKGLVVRIVTLTVVGLVLLNPLADLATAMVVVRGMRESASPGELVAETWHVLLHERHRLDTYRDNFDLDRILSIYDETYIANPVLNRFIETKYHDNMLAFVQGFSPIERDALWGITVEQLIAVLPQPALDLLSIGIDKGFLMVSMGDHIANLSLGLEVGGLKTGSMFAHGLALFGPAFLLFYIGLCVLSYLMWESLCATDRDGRLAIAPVAMLLAWPLFIYGISGESIVKLLHGFLRNYAQSILLYSVVFWAVRGMLRIGTSQTAFAQKSSYARQRKE
ncbi:MAG: hypothetical protein J0M00_03060 [Burkholderiales bacterium]|nr:hypothetical protein [Burkholderiales bacterium]